jgi:hypothetical protein
VLEETNTSNFYRAFEILGEWVATEEACRLLMAAKW